MKKWIKYSIPMVLIISGILLLLFYPIKHWIMPTPHVRITKTLVDKNKKNHHKRNYDLNAVQNVSMKNVIKARLHPNDVSIVGQILIPKVKIHLPIGDDSSNQTLMLSAGEMKPNQKMGIGNYALAGHHMINKKALFTPLYNHVQKGMMIYITDMHHVYQYQVNVLKFIDPTNTKVIDNTNIPTITLITCNDSGSKRLLVQGKLIKTMNMHNIPNNIIKDLTDLTNNYDVLKGY